jgi:hypothetical protein
MRPKSPRTQPDGAAGALPPSLRGRSLIPIDPGSGPVLRSNGKSDPYTFWMAFFNTKELKYSSPKEREKIIEQRTNPSNLSETLRLLNVSRKFQDVHAALLGYLFNHPDKAESWMYRALALAIELVQGSRADVKTALAYAADLARRSHNPNDLVATADMLLSRGYFERVGPLLDEAMTKVPHRGEPILESIMLASKTRDPSRMADSVDRLLSLGWPGMDEVARAEAVSQVEALITTLRELGNTKAADELKVKFDVSQARDLFVRLSWDGYADFDLRVTEPYGVTTSSEMQRSVFGGALLQNGYGKHPEEVYVCPRGFDGDYQIGVSTIWTDPSKPVTRLSLEVITHEGTPDEKKQVFELRPDKPVKPVVAHLSGGRRKVVLPYFDPVASFWEAVQRARKPGRPPARNAPANKNPAGAPSSSGASAAPTSKPAAGNGP